MADKLSFAMLVLAAGVSLGLLVGMLAVLSLGVIKRRSDA